MAKGIKGITIELGANTQPLQKALADVNKKSRDLQGELREVERGLKFNPGNAELAAQKQRILAEQVEATAEKLTRLKDAQEQVNQQFKSGKISQSQYDAFQREIIETESKLDSFEGKLKSSQSKVEKFGKAMKEAGENMKSAGESVKNAGSTMTGFVTGPLLAGLGLATKGTEELREDLARLEQNANSAGISADTMSEAFTRLSGVTSETDSNVEGLSNLLATGFDEAGLLETLDALSGAVIKFPDTLKIEGLADGLQETLATGKAIGPFAELLERMGINLDDFNEGLAEASEKGKEQNFILQTLADTGLAKVNEQYRKNNDELVKSKESTANFQQAMAEMGETLAPIMTAVTEAVTGLVEKFNALSPTGQKIALVVAGIAAAIGPLLMVIGTLITSIGSIITLFSTVAPVIAGVAGPIAIAIAAVAALVAGGILLYKNWDTVKAKAIELKNKLVQMFNQMKSGISNAMNTARNTMSNVWNNIKSSVSNTVSSIVSTVRNRFQDMVSAAQNRMNSVLSTIRGVWNNVMGFFRGINLYSIGRNIIQGLINGVKGMAYSLINSVKGVVNGAVEGAKRLLGINSPSRVFMEIGEFTGEGFALGIDSMTKAVSKAGQAMADSSIPELPKMPKIPQVTPSSKTTGPVIFQSVLNGRVIAEEIFPDMDNLLANNVSLSGYMRGSR